MPKKPKIVNNLPCGPLCGDCPFRDQSRGYVEPVLQPNSMYAVLGEQSLYWDILEGTPFAGPVGGALEGKLQLAGLSRLDVSLIPSIRCRPIAYETCTACEGDGALLIDVLQHQFEYGVLEEPVFDPCLECAGTGWRPSTGLDGDHVDIDPEPGQIIECMTRYGHDTLKGLTKRRLTIALGAGALFALTGKLNVGDFRGSVVDTTSGRALVTYNPRWIAAGSQHMEPVVRRDFSRIPSIVAGTENLGLETNYIRDPEPEVIRALKCLRTTTMDLETTGGLDPLKGGDILMASVSRRPGEGIVIPTGVDLAELLEGLDEVVGQNFYSYDAWWLHHRGYVVPQTIVDTKVLAHYANPHTPNDLYFIQSEYAEPPMPTYWKDKKDYEDDLEQVAMLDADATKRSELGLVARLKAEGRWETAENIIIPWCRLAFELRRDGIRTHVGRLANDAERISTEVFEGGAALSRRSGVPIPKKSKTGIPSPQAIKKHLYTTLGLPAQRHPKTHKITTDEPRLKRLYRWCQRHGRDDGVDFIGAMIGQPNPVTGNFEGGLKQRSTMAKDMRKFAKSGLDEDGKVIAPVIYIHAEPKITGTETGRLSYELLHQIPPYCKPAFLPDEGHLFLQFDYKQLELLVMLWCAREWELLARAIDEGLDFHRMTAADFYDVPYDEVLGEQRKAIKPISLGRLYGKGVESTARDMEMSKAEVEATYRRYDEVIPGLSEFQQREVAGVERKGYIVTEYGWKRYFTKDEQRNTHRDSVATLIYNTRIQSNAGLRVREALINIWRELKERYGEGVGARARMVLTVHDSGVFSVHPDELANVVEIVKRHATAPARHMPAPKAGFPDGVPFPIDLEVGTNYGEMIPWEKYESGEVTLKPLSMTDLETYGNSGSS